MTYHFSIAALVVVFVVLHSGNASRILGIFPTASISHQVVFRRLTLELNKRGHELVILTTDPVHDSTLNNYTEIDLSFLYDYTVESNVISVRGVIEYFDSFQMYEPLIHIINELVLSHPEVQKLYAPESNQKFDLILLELLFFPALMPFAHRFDAPIIGMTSFGLSVQLQYSVGNPLLTSHPTVWELSTEITGELTFWRRLVNFYKVTQFVHYYRSGLLPRLDVLAKKYFGDHIPDLLEIERNVSLIFEHQQGPISFVQPTVPKVIKIGGFHVSNQTKPLTKELKKMLDEATQGFVYMSLGTNVRSNMLSNEALAEFVSAFAQMPYLVIWKFEEDFLPGKPDNVMIMKWTPQQALLAHPNLKVFIYQGGLQSTEEAITHGVPLVGFPVNYDQDMQVEKMVSLGVAKKLEITSVNGNDLLEAVQTIALDSSYKERMLNLRSLVKDNPRDLLENAIWWTEFVIRHKGASHLQSTTAEEPWYRRQDMDIVAFISAGFTIVLISALVLVYITFKLIYSCTRVSHHTRRKID